MKKKRSCYSYNGAQCSVEGCEKPAKENGMCGAHAQRVRRYGDPHYVTPEHVRRANNRAAQPRLGNAKQDTYRKHFGRHAHRVAAEKKLGRPLLPGEIVHHADGDKHNNHPDNLEVMTQAEHARIHMLKRNGNQHDH